MFGSCRQYCFLCASGKQSNKTSKVITTIEFFFFLKILFSLEVETKIVIQRRKRVQTVLLLTLFVIFDFTCSSSCMAIKNLPIFLYSAYNKSLRICITNSSFTFIIMLLLLVYPKVAISSGGNIHVHKSFAVAAFIVHVLRMWAVGTTVL